MSDSQSGTRLDLTTNLGLLGRFCPPQFGTPLAHFDPEVVRALHGGGCSAPLIPFGGSHAERSQDGGAKLWLAF